MPKISKKPQAVANLESAIVRAVLAGGGLSRAELSRELKLVASTTGIYVDRLIERGYLLETTRPAQRLGRPPVVIELNPKKGRFIGVDFDARQVVAVAVDFAQQPIREVKRTLPARATAERVLVTIEEAIGELIGPQRGDVLGIGLGVPGPIDPERGLSLRYQFIRDWQNVPIGPRIAERFPAPVFVENNLRLMAMAELWCGQGRGLRNLVCLGIRSGIGTGVIVDGKLLRGAHNLAGEIGSWPCPEQLVPSGKRGTARTIEDVASLTALLSDELPNVPDLLAAAEQGDAAVLDTITSAAKVHAWTAYQLVSLLDPERVVVAGPLVDSDVYLRALEQSFKQLGDEALADRLQRSTLGAGAGGRGAAALAFHHWKPRQVVSKHR
ncbi:MAG TPA: ROK family transcriptional regulator [Pirellulales bacterium]|nr:ROK family transcriptional regulator [Pirellulales bacterium]